MFVDSKVAYWRKHVNVREARRLSFLRQSVAYVLSESARDVPHIAMIVHFDVTPLVQYTDQFAKEPADLRTLNSHRALTRLAVSRNFSTFYVKALAHALVHAPTLNAFLDYSPMRTGGIVYHAKDINVGLTVHTTSGVVKPVLANPHLKPFEVVTEEMRDLTRRTRRTDPEVLYWQTARLLVKEGLRQLDLASLRALYIWLRHTLFHRPTVRPEFAKIPEEQRLKPEELLGATVTIANIGTVVEGHQTVTAIIPPEISMVGIGDLHLEPCVVGGQVEPRYMVTMALTGDHRAMDAGDVFPWLERMRNYFRNPAQIYEWKPGDKI